MKPAPAPHSITLPISNSELDLLRRHLAGEHAAFHELMMRHYDLVLFVVRSRVDTRTAEEIARATFLALHEHAEQVLGRMDGAANPTEELCGWLVGFARDKATEHNRGAETNPIRANRLREKSPEARYDPELDALVRCLSELPAVLREYVRFHYFDGLTVKAIGTLNGKSERYVERQLKSARGYLSHCGETILDN